MEADTRYPNTWRPRSKYNTGLRLDIENRICYQNYATQKMMFSTVLHVRRHNSQHRVASYILCVYDYWSVGTVPVFVAFTRVAIVKTN